MSMNALSRLVALLARAGQADAMHRALVSQKTPREYADLSKLYGQSASISRLKSAATLVGTIAVGGAFTVLSQWFSPGALRELSTTLGKNAGDLTNAGLGIFVEPSRIRTEGETQIKYSEISGRQGQGQASSTQTVDALRQLVSEVGQQAQRAFSGMGG
jgi:hypothetical protein